MAYLLSAYRNRDISQESFALHMTSTIVARQSTK
jgi:hypothetical protein